MSSTGGRPSRDLTTDRSDQVAVILGASGGLGLGLARRFGIDGARLVLADIAAPALESAGLALRDMQVDAMTVPTDVSEPEQVDALVRATIDGYGRVDVVCNAVGVAAHDQRPIWELTELDWRWHFDVNVWGVINVIRSFTPAMLAADRGHIINTASSVTFSSRSGFAPYDASKHAVLSLCETLQHDLRTLSSAVKVSVLIPGAIRSRMYDSEHNRQHKYGKGITSAAQRAEMQAYLAQYGADPDVLAEIIDRQLADGRFYVFARPEDLAYAEARLTEVRSGFLGPASFRRAPGPGAAGGDG